MSQCVLAIDPALSTTGWAVLNYDQEIQDVGKFKTSPILSTTDRIHAVVHELYEQAQRFPVVDVVLENGFIGANAKTGLQLASLRGAIIEIFTWFNYPVRYMLPSEIRSILNHKGNATKEEIAESIRSFYKPDNKFMIAIGPYSDKQNKHKTSDIYDAISIGLAYIRAKQSGLVL